MDKTPITIMVADDDPGIREAISTLLEDEGYAVRSTADGGTVSELKSDLPDLLLLDIWMSGTNGSDVYRHLKEDDRTRHIPVIMVSANRDTGIIAKDAGADDYITKPFESDELILKIEKNLRKTRH